MIAETLRQAIAQKEWTISRAAREADVDRTFLSRLLSGHPPPRARDGRKSADDDPRYEQLAAALGLDPDAFLNQVQREQELRTGNTPDAHNLLLSRVLADVQREYDPETTAELNLVVGRLGQRIQESGGTMEFYRQLLAQPALHRRRRAGASQSSPELMIANHKGRDPLWVDDNLPPLCDALIELGYRCHTVQVDVGLDVRFDMAAVLQKLGTREPVAIRQVMGLSPG
ncbi:MAG: helix-turn-helix transcriptional regulator [Alphaproteobacteria bacterium]|nr:helix-turn-helix transcriptional regulator [Alphaproteobacteria bacterium]